MRKKIIGMAVVIAVLAMLCTQSARAQPNVVVDAWTDKPQYDPGEKGKLKISILNLEEDDAVQIYNITLEYPWFRYDAKEGKWIGNDTIKGDTRILATMTSKGSENDHYYLEVEFTVPSDGRASSGSITLEIWMSDPTNTEYKGTPWPPVSISVAYPYPRSLVDLDTWMISLIVAIVVCTIILAIVAILSRRRASPPRALVPRAPAPPPPPKTKAKTG